MSRQDDRNNQDERKESVGVKDDDNDDDAPSVARESFPNVLHAMLDEIGAQGLSRIVSWQPHGRCFVVHRRREFVEAIMPVYFRMSKFVSFQRQLNLYGFNRITKGQDKGGYYHELFLRGRKNLCKNIRRRQIKGTGTRKPDAPETEPNFYVMDFLPESSSALSKKMPHIVGLSTQTSSVRDNPKSLTGMMGQSAAIPSLPTVHSSMNPTPSWVPSLPLTGAASTPGALLYQQHPVNSGASHTNLSLLINALHAAGSTTPQGVMLRAALASLTSNQPLTSNSLVNAVAASLTNALAPSPLVSFRSNSDISKATPATFLAAMQLENNDFFHSWAAFPTLAGEHSLRCQVTSNNSTPDGLAAAMQSGVMNAFVARLAGNASVAEGRHHTSSRQDGSS